MEGWASALTALADVKRLEVYQELIEIQKHVLGINDSDTLFSISGLAWVYDLEGMLQEASDVYLDVVEKQTKVLGRDHVSTLDSMCGLASNYSRLGKKGAALKILEEVLQLQTRVLGSDHDMTLWTREEIKEVAGELTREGRKGRIGRYFGK
jgi:hypothetical protein